MKTSKGKRICTKGYSCGLSCISLSKACRKGFTEGIAVTLDNRLAVYNNPAYRPKEVSKPKPETAPYKPPKSLNQFIKLGKEVADKYLGKEAEEKISQLERKLEDPNLSDLEKFQVKMELTKAKSFRFSNLRNTLLAAGKDRKNLGASELMKTTLFASEARVIKQRLGGSTETPRSLKLAEKRETREHLEEFLDLIGGISARERIQFMYEEPRAYATEARGGEPPLLNIGRNSKSTIFHEMGHHLEFNNLDLAKAANKFIEKRATGPVQPLSEITGNKNYGEDEVAYPDKFISPYVGKKYNGWATEVVSVGLEHFSSAKGMAKLYEQDPEHFFLILGAIEANQRNGKKKRPKK